MRSNLAAIREGIIETAPVDAGETRAFETLGRLTRGTLHELANPLVALLGTAELALAEAERETKLHERLVTIQATATELAAIVRALQAFVRSQHEPPRRLSLGEAAEAAIELVERVTPVTDVSLATRGDAAVFAAPGAVARELVELLLRAIRERGPRRLRRGRRGGVRRRGDRRGRRCGRAAAAGRLRRPIRRRPVPRAYFVGPDDEGGATT